MITTRGGTREQNSQTFVYNLSIMKLSVVIPSYNEMGNLRKGVLEKVENFLRRKKFDFEVIVVDDGSTDGSREFVDKFTKENPEFKLIENSHTGKAGAVTAGMLKATGDYILFTDMDQATPIEEVEKLLEFMPDYDIVIGSRAARKGSPLIRQFISKSAVVMRKTIVGLRDLSDTQCGFKIFKKEAAHAIFEKVKKVNNGFHSIRNSSVTSGFDVELLYIGKSLGYSIKEVPVDWLYVETRRVNPVRDSIDGTIDLLRIRRNITKGKYD